MLIPASFWQVHRVSESSFGVSIVSTEEKRTPLPIQIWQCAILLFALLTFNMLLEWALSRTVDSADSFRLDRA